MKRTFKLMIVLIILSGKSFGQDEYYFGDKGKFNPNIPTPESFFGFKIGSELVRYDKVVEYFKLLADKSDRTSIQVFGKSWENREQVKLFVTSPENQRNLEDIRKEHLKLIDPGAAVDYKNQKVIVELSYNVHGGEIAGTDASVLTAYYLVASEDPDVIRRLNESVVLVEPSQNPDGRERAANYINGFHSWPAVTDPNDVEHGSGTTPHRGNHFWNDLNRDWLALSQIESRNRVAFYHKWYPNVFLDYHEMGSGSTYYFEPSPLNTWSSILPISNYETLNGILAKYFSKALDQIGSLYYTKENFTNLSPIYGSTYPDYLGGVGTTLEIGSTSGVAIETPAGVRTFRRNLRDNLVTGIAAFRAATDEKETFLKHQKEFFKSALSQAEKLPTKSIVFGSREDKSINRIFVEHLLQHQIKVYELTSSFVQDGKKFEPGSAYVVPLRQSQFRLLQSIFEENETNQFSDSTGFYDISAWSTAHGFGIPFVKVKSAVKEGSLVAQVPVVGGSVAARSELAYAFDFSDYLAPRALYYLQQNGVQTRVAQKAFSTKTTSGNKSFVAGSIVIPVAYQTVSPDELFKLLNQASKLAGITVHAIGDGFSTAGVDLGSNNVRVIKQPTVAAITGGNWTSIGELWALLGNRFDIPLVKITPQSAERADLNKYSSIILTGQVPGELNKKLSDWVDNGGTLIALSGASQWALSLVNSPSPSGETGAGRQQRGAAPEEGQSAPVTAAARGGFGRGEGAGERLNGVIVSGNLNLNHPLTYGFTSKDFYVLKNSTAGLNVSNPDNIVLKTTGDLINGFVTQKSLPGLKDKVVIATGSRGRGGVVAFGESPTFRGYWLAPGRILTNALFFGVPNRGGFRGGAEE